MKRLNAGDLLRGGPLRESCVEDGTQTVRRSQPQKDEGTRRGGDGLCKVQVMVLPLTCSVTFVTILNPSLSQFPRLQNGDTLFLMVVRVKWIHIKCLEPSTYYKFNKHRQFWFPEQRESENRVWKSGQESHCVCVSWVWFAQVTYLRVTDLLGSFTLEHTLIRPLTPH